YIDEVAIARWKVVLHACQKHGGDEAAPEVVRADAVMGGADGDYVTTLWLGFANGWNRAGSPSPSPKQPLGLATPAGGRGTGRTYAWLHRREKVTKPVKKERGHSHRFSSTSDSCCRC